jgi:hypothetical protein
VPPRRAIESPCNEQFAGVLDDGELHFDDSFAGGTWRRSARSRGDMTLQAADRFISDFWASVDQGVFTSAELDQMIIYGAAVEPLSPARSVGLVRDKLVKELSRVTRLPLGWGHFNESESSNPHPVWGLIRDLENSTARELRHF